MIYIYGDSHARFGFKDLELPHINLYESSVTMFRIGRDNKIINFNNNIHNKHSMLCFVYGEVDCRCHIQKQIILGKNEDDIINELICNYFTTIKNNVNEYKKIIVVGIIPQRNKNDYEKINGEITHEYPFVGNDEDRVRYTTKMNELIKNYCYNNDYIYFNPYDYYTNEDGTLRSEFSDTNVHLGNNSFFLEKFIDLYKTI
jgi:hypothetical protein